VFEIPREYPEVVITGWKR